MSISKQLVPNGASKALVLPKPFLEAIGAETTVDVDLQGDRIVITAHRSTETVNDRRRSMANFLVVWTDTKTARGCDVIHFDGPPVTTKGFTHKMMVDGRGGLKDDGEVRCDVTVEPGRVVFDYGAYPKQKNCDIGVMAISMIDGMPTGTVWWGKTLKSLRVALAYCRVVVSEFQDHHGNRVDQMKERTKLALTRGALSLADLVTKLPRRNENLLFLDRAKWT